MYSSAASNNITESRHSDFLFCFTEIWYLYVFYWIFIKLSLVLNTCLNKYTTACKLKVSLGKISCRQAQQENQLYFVGTPITECVKAVECKTWPPNLDDFGLEYAEAYVRSDGMNFRRNPATMFAGGSCISAQKRNIAKPFYRTGRDCNGWISRSPSRTHRPSPNVDAGTLENWKSLCIFRSFDFWYEIDF